MEINFFELAGENLLKEIKGFTEEIDLDAYRLIFSEGSDSDSFYVIQEGAVKITKKAKEENKEISITFLPKGSIFGELGILLEMPRSASARTADKVKLLKFSKENLEKLKGDKPQIYEQLMSLIFKILLERIKTLDNVIKEAISWVSGMDSPSKHLMQLINEKTEMRVVLTTDNELIGTIKTVSQGISGMELLLRDSSGNIFLIPYHSILYMVERKK